MGSPGRPRAVSRAAEPATAPVAESHEDDQVRLRELVRELEVDSCAERRGGAGEEHGRPLARATLGRRRRTGRAAVTLPQAGTGPGLACVQPNPGAPVTPLPEDVQQLLRLPDTDLRRRAEELGPIPEVLEAIQKILCVQNGTEGKLPRYEERR